MDIVSGCLIGINCRYDGTNRTNKEMIDLFKQNKLIPVCPEQLGGLPTPRIPAEIQSNQKVINKKREDVTEKYLSGATEALKIAQIGNCKKAYLKSKSPMCGCGKIYDGTFLGKTISGDGIFSSMLKKNGIAVIEIE